MASKVYNRVPNLVNTPSTSQVKESYFVQSNWKGLTDDKNYITVDQETFTECNNVYVDAEGMLKNRPCIKPSDTYILDSTGNLTQIVNVWDFVNVVVYLSKTLQGTYLLSFVKEGENILQENSTSNVKLICTELKIFIFEEASFKYYDLNTHSIEEASEYIYTPVTKLITNGVEADLEQPNEFTTSSIHRYLYTNYDSIKLDKFIGKTLEVTINDEVYTINFTTSIRRVLVSKLYTFDTTVNNLSISDKGNMVYSVVTDTVYTIYYSSDGMIFKSLPYLSDIVSPAKISGDGSYVMVLCTKAPYIISVLDTQFGVYQSWTNILYDLDKTSYEANINYIWFDDVSNFKFKTFDDFVIIYNTHSNEYNIYENVLSVGNGNKDINIIYTANDEIIYDVVAKTEPLVLETGNTITTSLSTSTTGGNFNSVLASYLEYAYENYALVIENSTLKLYDRSNNYNVYTLPLTYENTTDGFSYTGITTPNIRNDFYLHVSIRMSSGEEIWDVSINVPDLYGYIPIHYEKSLIDYVNNTSLVVCKYYKYYEEYENTSYYDKLMIYDAGKKAAYYYDTSELCDMALVDTDVLKTCSATDLYTYKYNITSNLWNVSYSTLPKEITDAVISKTGDKILTNSYLIYDTNDMSYTDLLFESIPVKIKDDYLYLLKYSDNVYSLYSSTAITYLKIDEYQPGSINYIVPSHHSELSNHYISNGKTLWISSYPTTGDFKWYFPKINTEVMDYNISNLHPISLLEMAVFTKNNVYYVKTTENGYEYYKSKIQVGCEEGSDVITSFDGKYTIFASKRGLAYLTYQDFVASTEQTVNYISDVISHTFNIFNTKPIKLFKTQFWIVCYIEDFNKMLVLDVRSGSWWPMSFNFNIDKIVTVDNIPYAICSNDANRFYSNFVATENECFDKLSNDLEYVVNWIFKSQKLHLGNVNYFKHISSITMSTQLDNQRYIDLQLQVTNYRNVRDTTIEEYFKFNVDALRTFVIRLNYYKVNEFQYIVKSNLYDKDLNNVDNVKALIENNKSLSLSNIIIKYKITGQVR